MFLLILSEMTFILPEIIIKPMVFLWFQGEQKLINLLKLAQYLKRNFETIANDLLVTVVIIYW